MHRHWRRHHRWHSHGPGLWGRRARFFDAGEVRLALLSLLGERPMHGYELMKQLEARSGGTYRASAGTVYPTLQLLEDEGLVAVAEENGKRVYRITESGRTLLAEEAAAVGRIWERAEDWGDWEAAYDPGAWEVARPAMKLVKRAFRAVTRGADPDAVRAILARAEAEIGELERRGR
jgi:DNA-binding PadR family transcriptional regulator